MASQECKKCRKKVKEEHSFCPRCGTEREIVQDTETTPTVSTLSRLLQAIVWVAAVLLVSAAILLYLFLTSQATLANARVSLSTERERQFTLIRELSKAQSNLTEAYTEQQEAWASCKARGVSNIFSGGCLGNRNIADLESSASAAEANVKIQKSDIERIRQWIEAEEVSSASYVQFWLIVSVTLAAGLVALVAIYIRVRLVERVRASEHS